eukprot:2501687-Amphidinium_carterae.4
MSRCIGRCSCLPSMAVYSLHTISERWKRLMIHSAVKALVQQRAELRAGRCLGMIMPPQWAKQGVWKFKSYGESGLEVEHRFLGEKYIVSMDELPPHDAYEQLYLHENYSEERASVASQKDVHLSQKYLLTKKVQSHVPPDVMHDALRGRRDASLSHTPERKKSFAMRTQLSRSGKRKRGADVPEVVAAVVGVKQIAIEQAAVAADDKPVAVRESEDDLPSPTA